MKTKWLIVAVVMILFSVPARAQSASHQNAFTWAAVTAPAGATFTGYNVYRAPGTCGPASVFVKITATPITALSFTDTTGPNGALKDGDANCYYVTAVFSTGESARSDMKNLVTPTTIAALPIPGNVTSLSQ
jgi:hypothetical protein